MKRKEVKKRSRIVFDLDEQSGRRLGLDRRQSSFDLHVPERRSGRNRRSGKDLRSNSAPRIPT
ncbi:MAG: hypothetical protein BBJ60_00540 [Desulfobacterales bacterium S7086C20]|nr:MAG: hypothetical protein BBJ60_00540 [Desulfobacterales bacterium S7086C20]